MGGKKINSNPLELEEIFLDGLLRKRGGEGELQQRKIESPIKRRIFYFFFAFAVAALFFLLAVSFFFQVLNYEKYRVMAEDNKFLNLLLKSERGIIYDRNMEPLVFNEAAFDLYFDKSAKGEFSSGTLGEIGKIVNLSDEELKNKISGSEANLILLKENLSHRELVALETKSREIPAIAIKKAIKRNYLEEKTISHILGYLGKISKNEIGIFASRKNYELNDLIGKEGLEKMYEETLREEKGVLEIERDARGREISRKIKIEPDSGSSLVLNLDLGLQKKASQVLRDILDSGEGRAGVVIALDPKNGGVLASVSLPSFDNNVFSRGITKEELEEINENPYKPQLNRVLGGVYAVGSTIKPLVGIAALEEGIIDEQTSFFCPEELCLENQYTKELECYGDWAFHGETSIRRAIAESVNPFFYIVAGGYEKPKNHIVDSRLPKSFSGLGSRKIAEWLVNFGWGGLTGVDLPGEVAGRVPTPEWKDDYFASRSAASRKWYLGDTYNLSIGQGYILVTPLQVASAFQAIANYGTIFKPKLVKKIIKHDSEEEILPEILKNLPADKKNIEIIREGMRQAVSTGSGSAYLLNSLSKAAAAKTGTAETGKKDILHNWITVFAPYENPEIVLTVMIEEVHGLKRVAQTAARDILDWYFTQPQ